MALPSSSMGNYGLLLKTKSNLFEIIDSAITIAALHWPEELVRRRDYILQKLDMGLPQRNDSHIVAAKKDVDDEKTTPPPDRPRHQLEREKERETEINGNDDDDERAKKKPGRVVRIKILLPSATTLEEKGKPSLEKKPQSSQRVVAGGLGSRQHNTAIVGFVQEGRSRGGELTKAPAAAIPSLGERGGGRVGAERCLSDDEYEKKLASAKRKLQQGYEAWQESRKRSRVIDFWADVPKASKTQVCTSEFAKPKVLPDSNTNTKRLSSKPCARPRISSAAREAAAIPPHQNHQRWTPSKNECSTARQLRGH